MSPLETGFLVAWTLLGAMMLAQLLFSLFVWIGKQWPRRRRWPKQEFPGRLKITISGQPIALTGSPVGGIETSPPPSSSGPPTMGSQPPSSKE